jgi:hypothetical protein
MALPSTTYDIATVSNPSSTLTDFSLIVDLSTMSSAWWSAVDTSDGTKGRASKGDGVTELACDWIDFDDTAETGLLRVLWSGTLASTGTQQVRIYPPQAANASYVATDTYGQYNAYDSNIKFYSPLGGGTDRTLNGLSGSSGNGVVEGGNSSLIGESTYYDGTQYFDFGDVVDTTEPITIRTLIYYDGSLPVGGIISKRGSAGYQYDLRFSSGNLNFLPTAGGSKTYGAITGNSWHFVAITLDASGNLTFFVDGDTSSFSGISLSTRAVSLYLGSENSGYGWMRGFINQANIDSTNRSIDYLSQEMGQVVDNSTFWGTWTNVPVGGTEYTLTSEYGTLSITGKEANTLYNRIVSSESGSIDITGQEAFFQVGKVLSAENGSVSITGNDVSILLGRNLDSESGSLSVVGKDATLSYGRGYTVACETGELAIVGNDASFKQSFVLAMEAGTISLNGRNVSLNYSGATIYKETITIPFTIETSRSVDFTIETSREVDFKI